MSWSATSKDVGLSLETWQSFCALLCAYRKARVHVLWRMSLYDAAK